MNYFKIVNETLKDELLKDYIAHNNWNKYQKEILQDLGLDETFQFGQNPEVLWLNKIPGQYANSFMMFSTQSSWCIAKKGCRLSKKWRKICSKYDLVGYPVNKIIEKIDESFYGTVNGQISFLSKVYEIVMRAENVEKFNNAILISEIEFYRLKYENAKEKEKLIEDIEYLTQNKSA